MEKKSGKLRTLWITRMSATKEGFLSSGQAGQQNTTHGSREDTPSTPEKSSQPTRGIDTENGMTLTINNTSDEDVGIWKGGIL